MMMTTSPIYKRTEREILPLCFTPFIMPPPVGKDALYNGPRCLSVRSSIRLSVPCLDITRERKGLGSPNLAGWKLITQVLREPI